MLLLGKIALGFGTTVLLAGAYTFRQGVLRVDVDETRGRGSHVHVWVPAAIVPMAMHFIPREKMLRAGERSEKFMPLVHAVAKELQKYPEAELVEVHDGAQYVRIRTHNGSVMIDTGYTPDQAELLWAWSKKNLSTPVVVARVGAATAAYP